MTPLTTHLLLDAVYTDAALRLAVISADVNNYVDHVEHNEVIDRDWVLGSAAKLRELALELAAHEGLNPVAVYSQRLEAIQQRNVLNNPFLARSAAHAAFAAKTWRDLQITQAEHDRVYHPDVFGLTKNDQLRHYAFHVAKLAGLLAQRARTDDGGELTVRRIADLMLFGVKLATVMGVKLDPQPLPVSVDSTWRSAGSDPADLRAANTAAAAAGLL